VVDELVALAQHGWLSFALLQRRLVATPGLARTDPLTSNSLERLHLLGMMGRAEVLVVAGTAPGGLRDLCRGRCPRRDRAQVRHQQTRCRRG